MTIIALRKALETYLLGMVPALPTVFQNTSPPKEFDDTKAHQKCFVLPAENRTLGLREKTTLQSGIFQVNLCYPSGIGARAAEQRADALQDRFAAGLVLEADGVKIRIRGKPSIAAPTSLSPYTVPVSIRYQTIN